MLSTTEASAPQPPENNYADSVGAAADDASPAGDARLRALSAASQRAAERLSSAAESADGVELNVRTMTAMMAQLLFGIRDVWTNSAAPERATADALAAVRRSGERIAELVDTATQITRVVGVIEEITQTTNLLALNATIEAAHAGEHGRGFGVVAAEVKNLSRQTAAATIEIREKIARILAASTAAGEAMSATEASVTHIHAMVADVTRTVTAQDELTQTVKTSVAEAADSAGALARSVGEIGAELTDALAQARAPQDGS